MIYPRREGKLKVCKVGKSKVRKFIKPIKSEEIRGKLQDIEGNLWLKEGKRPFAQWGGRA